MYGANVIIFEGILAFYNPKVLNMLDMKIFVDTDADIRLARRLKRDISLRGRDLDGVLKQYTRMVQPAFNHYIAPTMVHADIIVPRGGENKVAIELIVQHVHAQLQIVNELKFFIDFIFTVYCFFSVVLSSGRNWHIPLVYETSHFQIQSIYFLPLLKSGDFIHSYETKTLQGMNLFFIARG